MSINFFNNHTHHYRSLNPYLQQRGFGHDLFDAMRNKSSAYVPRQWIRSTMMGKGAKKRHRPLPAAQILSGLQARRKKFKGGSLFLPGQRGGSLNLPGQRGGFFGLSRGAKLLREYTQNHTQGKNVRGFSRYRDGN